MQWRARGWDLGHQVVALAHSEQGCALVGLCLNMCEVGVRAGGRSLGETLNLKQAGV